MSQKNKKINTEWNLGLLYSSKKDPQIEKDLLTIESAVDAFEKKYKNNKEYLSDQNALFQALTEYEKLEGMPQGVKPMMYFHYLSDLNGADQEVTAKLSMLQQRYAKISNKLLFFALSFGTLSDEVKNKFLDCLLYTSDAADE